MSTGTTVHFCRPGRPPVVRTGDLAAFLERIEDAGLVEPSETSLNVKFGWRIDKDDKPTSYVEPVDDVIGTVREIDWDIEFRATALSESAARLREKNRRIYRAQWLLGRLRDDVTSSLRRDPGPQNENGLDLCSLGVELGARAGWHIEQKNSVCKAFLTKLTPFV